MAGRHGGELAVIVDDLSVDDGVVDTFGKLVGFGVGSVIDNSCRIEDGDVREVAGLEQTALRKMCALRGKGSDLADGGLQRKEVLVTCVVSEEARHGSKRAGMRVRPVRR